VALTCPVLGENCTYQRTDHRECTNDVVGKRAGVDHDDRTQA
jgi:hypothetical protein